MTWWYSLPYKAMSLTQYNCHAIGDDLATKASACVCIYIHISQLSSVQYITLPSQSQG